MSASIIIRVLVQPETPELFEPWKSTYGIKLLDLLKQQIASNGQVYTKHGDLTLTING